MVERGGERDAPVDHLGLFLQFADKVQAAHERAHRPAYAETCVCGGSVEVGRDASRADLRRIHANFLGRHRKCLAHDLMLDTTVACIGFPPPASSAQPDEPGEGEER